MTNTRIFPPQNLESTGTYEGQPVAPDAAIAAVIEPQLKRVAELKAQSLGVVLDTPLPTEAPIESPLGNLFTDVLLQSVPGADISVNNTSGGIRGDLAAGPLTYGALFQVYPFDNLIVRVSMTGATLKNLLARRVEGRSRPGIAGLQARVQCVAGAPRVELIRPNGQQVGDDEKVWVVTTDFLATGGDGIFDPAMLPAPLIVEETGIIYREAAAEWLTRRGGRLRDTDLINLENPRWLLPGPPPMRCQ